jgi:hypothetical protein
MTDPLDEARPIRVKPNRDGGAPEAPWVVTTGLEP